MRTPLVLVAQHDRSFVRRVDLLAVARAVDAHARRHHHREQRAARRSGRNRPNPPFEDIPADGERGGDIIGEGGDGADAAPLPPPVNYVGFPTGTTLTHRRHVLTKYALRLEPIAIPIPSDGDGDETAREGEGDGCLAPEGCSAPSSSSSSSSLELLPLVQFYDSMHVARTAWYLSNVFGRERYCSLPRGGFIEDTLGQRMLSEIRGPRGLAAHADFGVFLARFGDGGRGAATSTGTTPGWRTRGAPSSHSPSGTRPRRRGGRWRNRNGRGLATGGEGDPEDAPEGDYGEGVVFLRGFLDPPGTSAFSNEGGRRRRPCRRSALSEGATKGGGRGK